MSVLRPQNKFLTFLTFINILVKYVITVHGQF